MIQINLEHDTIAAKLFNIYLPSFPNKNASQQYAGVSVASRHHLRLKSIGNTLDQEHFKIHFDVFIVNSEYILHLALAVTLDECQ